MPLLLYRYVLRDLLRVMLLTTAVLVTVIAFGAAIKPLTNDQLLTATQAAKYIGLAIVPMLQFALPFSAGFASTLLMHRMANDNEVSAMAAAGISYRRILAPVAAVGVGLLAVMVLLTQLVIPRFWGVMHGIVSSDITRIFEASINRGEPFQVGNLQIFADDMAVQERPPGSDADTRLVLLRVAAAELDDQLRVVTDVTARQAVVDIYRRSGRTFLKLVMSDTVAYNSNTGQLVRTDQITPSRAITVTDVLEDDPMTMTQRQLHRLAANPDAFSEVIEARDALAAALRDAAVFEHVDRQLAGDGRLELEQDAPERKRFVVTADRLRAGVLERDDGEVEVVELRDGTAARRFAARFVEVARSASSRLQDPTFDVVMTDCTVSDLAAGGGVNPRAQLSIASLVVPGAAEADISSRSSRELIERARALPASSAHVEARVSKLEHEIESLQQEIFSRLNKRYALCVTAPLLLVLGATLAMWLRESLALTIYLWAFLPSIVDLILISGGDQMLRDGRLVGLAVLWSGNAALLGLLVLAYRRLARN